MSQLDLDQIEARAAEHRAALSGWLNCYSPLPEQEALEGAEGVLKEDVPAMAAEIRRLRAQAALVCVVCVVCETPVGWIDCPTGGWWAHDTHPADGHDASPKPAAEETHVVADDSDDPEHVDDCPGCEPADTLPAWLRQRFTASGVDWEDLDDTERSYWEHQAAAVRRAVDRGGFKTAAVSSAARP